VYFTFLLSQDAGFILNNVADWSVSGPVLHTTLRRRPFFVRELQQPLVASCRCDGSAIAAATGNQKTYVKPEAAITVFEFLMMGDVFFETC
jgi:hypothetical protein